MEAELREDIEYFQQIAVWASEFEQVEIHLTEEEYDEQYDEAFIEAVTSEEMGGGDET